MITEVQEHFMQMATDLAQYSIEDSNNGPFGAIIVKDGNIAGSSGNFIFRDTDPCAHAELIAIRDACKNLKSSDLSGCQIYSASEPCPMCLAAIYWAQISAIFYLNSKKQIVEYGSENLLQSMKNQTLEYIPDRNALNIPDNGPKILQRPKLVVFHD